MITITIEPTEDGARLDHLVLRHLRTLMPNLSRSNLKKWFTAKQVELNGAPAAPSQTLHAGKYEVNILNLDPRDVTKPIALSSLKGCFLPVIYEDEYLLVLNKASGTPSVPHSPFETETAVGAAVARCPKLSRVGAKSLEAGLLHRLDTGTSGLLVFAKSDAEYTRLRALWKTGAVRKFYRAISQSDKLLPTLPATINMPLARSAKSSKRMFCVKAASPLASMRGKPLKAITHMLAARVLNHGKPPLVDFELEITTGVMHQIRCHLAELGFPILGDALYHGAASERLWLHAWRLALPSREAKELVFEAELPEGWPKHVAEGKWS